MDQDPELRPYCQVARRSPGSLRPEIRDNVPGVNDMESTTRPTGEPASERDPNEAEHREFVRALGQRLGPRGIEDLIAAWRLEREIDAEDAREGSDGR